VTLILIEHDMDVALVVAERVTMMHDGRVIVEGTPAEIRANKLVHDLYLGSGHAA
jgi:branched-chain amino acid transport system ATP-binding protein